MRSQDPIHFAPQRKLGGGWICYKDSPSPPPAPDYTGAAQATAAGNLENAKYATAANRVNQYSPYGSETYTQGNPGSDIDPQWSKTISLSPTGQTLLDALNKSQVGISGLQNTATERVADAYSKPFNIGGADDATARAYSNIKTRLDPQWAHNEEMNDAQLANQGIMRGSEAYNEAKRTFNQAKNDAYTQADTQAMAYAPTAYQLDVAGRNQPLNELNAIRTGSQVTNPVFGSVPQQGQVPGPNYLGAASQQGLYDADIYNQQNASASNFNNGLFSLGGSIGSAFIKSDRRLKSNVERVGTHPLGIGIYEYDIFGKRTRGVMADEVEAVMPNAVKVDSDGFKMVNYSMVGWQI